MGKEKNKISFYIITYNEEKNILRCFNSVKDIVDEIILVDSFSTDQTVDIAKQFGAQIYLKKYENSQSEQRNFALSKVSFNWIFTIDADEIISENLKKNIRSLLTIDNLNGYWFSRRHYIEESKYLKYGYFYPDYQLRLFRNNKYKYKGRLHEQLNISKNKTREIKFDIYHFAKNQKYHSMKSITELGWYVKIQGSEYLDLNKNSLFYLFAGLFAFPYHFIGSFVRGRGYLDSTDGLKAAFVFSYLISAAYFYAFLSKLISKKITPN